MHGRMGRYGEGTGPYPYTLPAFGYQRMESMDVFALTRSLIDIESITGNEKAVGDWVFDYLQPLVTEYGGTLEKIEVEPNRNNVLAMWGEPVVTMSTHLDTVPPFFASREDDEFIHGRGACDVKGIIACMIHAAKALAEAEI